MKSALIAALVLFLCAPAFAHPGSIDWRGGHRCWKNCGNYDLLYAEYHLHDKNWKPIRLDSAGKPIREKETELLVLPQEPRPTESGTVTAPSPVVAAQAAVVESPDVLSLSPLIAAILGIVLLAGLLVLFIRRRRNNNR